MFTALARQLGRRYARVPGMLWHRRHADRGAVAVLVAILLPALIVLSGLVVDVGSWYVTKSQLQTAADFAALSGARSLPSSPTGAATVAQNVGVANVPGATVTSVTPYSGNSGDIQVTVSKTGSTFFWFGTPPTITASAVAGTTGGATASVYAASSSCNAITLNNQSSLSLGTVWSNGGISATGDPITIDGQADVAGSCSFPGNLNVPATHVTASASWPVPLPSTAQGNLPTSCQSGNVTISSSSWTKSNPPGMYCWTGTVTISSGSLAFNGYEFVSQSTSASAIKVTNDSSITLTGYCPGSCSAGTRRTLFYAVNGGISLGNSAAESLTGDVIAPNGNVTLNNSSGTTAVFLEASTVTINNSSSTTIPGTGPTPSGGVVRLLQ
jgi:hypothetical protein